MESKPKLVLKLPEVKEGTPSAFINCILTSAVIVHQMHLSVEGPSAYEKHKALNDLYEALPDHADSIAEAYQGHKGIIIKPYPSMDQTKYMNMDPLQFVEWLLNYVENTRGSMGTVSMIQNLIDELVQSIASTRYKLKFLK